MLSLVSNRFVCIHGHFYQPPRENPWLEEIESQESAQPFHDWNERINAECYAPNTASRIIDPEGRIIQIVSNYSKISFDFGPTLLSWLERRAHDVYEAILAADKKSVGLFTGNGSALGQVYNHVIMPLANRRDKVTQVKWGIEDFERRFERFPEGFWLPETAVDTETLEVLAEHDLKFTILSPYQAKTVRRIGEKNWTDVSGGIIDSKRAYVCLLPSGKSISIFFYDKGISHEVAFGSLLDNGENLAKKVIGAFDEQQDEPQLVHAATDGESYGHHHKHGDMALAYGLYYIESKGLARITNYGEFLERSPPKYEVQFIESSSWSCAHGIERWRSNCGCNTGKLGWNQDWRAPLRVAFDWLRDSLGTIYEKETSKYLQDCWNVRNDYIVGVLDRSRQNLENFLSKHTKKSLTPEEQRTILKLLEMQRHAMLMYTSCGWFFDEISGIETTQVIQYAARAIQLAVEVSGINLEDEFTKLLSDAPSNIPDLENGHKIYELFVKPASVNLLMVAAHYAISSLFERHDKAVIRSK